MVLQGISNGLGTDAPTIRRVAMMRRANETRTWLQTLESWPLTHTELATRRLRCRSTASRMHAPPVDLPRIYQGNATIYQGLRGGPPPPSGAGCNPQLLIAPRHKLDCSCHGGAATNIDARSESKAQRHPPAATASEAARAPKLHLAMIFQWFCKELAMV